MAVRFVLGRSGTGKSRYCIERIVESLVGGDSGGGENLVLLVPEQATYQAERAILSYRQVRGYHRLRVLSFDRLGYMLVGGGSGSRKLSGIGQQMIIHRILEENREVLCSLGGSVERTGLSRKLAEVVSELVQYAKSAEDVDGLVEKLDDKEGPARLKFSDIGLVLREYVKFVEGDYIDSGMQLNFARKAVGSAEFLNGANLWVDGFSGFTGSETAMLGELLKVCSEAEIALCMDASKIDLRNSDAGRLESVSLFRPTELCYAELLWIVRDLGLELKEPIVLNEAKRFGRCKELGHIEKNIFIPRTRKIKAGERVRLIKAVNVRAEVRFVAREILRLVREKGYRYREIAVIAPDIERYEHYVKAYFEEYSVPFFIDMRRRLNQHPGVELISSALAAVSGGFRHREVFRYLKSGAVSVERREVDLLENYCLAFGVSGRDWTSEDVWEFAGEGDEDFDDGEVDEIRRRASRELMVLRERLFGEGDAERSMGSREFTEVIFEFLEGVGLRGRLGEWIKEAEESGDYEGADEHRQFYDKLVELFDELVEVFGGREMKCGEFGGLLKSAFSQLTLAFIPPKLDQVLVGSIERSRHPEIRAAFLVGTVQGQFPVPLSREGILTDGDRRSAEAAGFEIGPTQRRSLEEYEYLVYIAFSRASEYLYVSRPVADEKGRAIVRSQFTVELEGLFEGLDEESVGDEEVSEGDLWCDAELSDFLCGRVYRQRRGKEEADSLIAAALSDERLRRGAEVASLAKEYENEAVLEEGTCREVFGDEVVSSATGLSTFSQCPYRYFARQVLGLRERREFKFEPLDVGDFYHRVLDSLVKRLKGQGRSFGTLGREEAVEILGEQIAKVMEGDSFISHFAGRGEHNRYIIRAACDYLEDFVVGILAMVGAGEFEPGLSEVEFGEGKAVEGPMFETGEGKKVKLRGKIDRIDFADTEFGKAALIFDYKRRWTGDGLWARIYHGLDMQLLIYLLAVNNAHAAGLKEVCAAGAFYIPIEASPETAGIEEAEKKRDKFRYKAKGIFDGRFAGMIDRDGGTGRSDYYGFFVKSDGNVYGHYKTSSAFSPVDFENVLEFGERLLGGDIRVMPYRLGNDTACRFCEFKAVCRFDWQVNNYNHLSSAGKGELRGGGHKR